MICWLEGGVGGWGIEWDVYEGRGCWRDAKGSKGSWERSLLALLVTILQVQEPIILWSLRGRASTSRLYKDQKNPMEIRSCNQTLYLLMFRDQALKSHELNKL